MFKYFIFAAMIVLQVQTQAQQVQQLNSDDEIKKFIANNNYIAIEFKGKRKRCSRAC